MKRYQRLILLAMPSIVFLGIAISGCSHLFDKVADKVLANEVGFDDREVPLTPYAIAASSDGVQLMGGQGGGLSCSLPPGMQALAFKRTSDQPPIALQIRQVCTFHDYCYRHGNATYGYSQADCDYILQQQAFRLCKYVSPEDSSGCETDARKVTIGVRLGGSGSFKQARAVESAKASTFFEFDPYPVRATIYSVVRIADAPQAWVRDGLLPKAAYVFDMRPSGSAVHVLGWRKDGEMVCSVFTIPGSFEYMNAAPMVVRTGRDGEDWFVWWRRGQLGATYGRFALLPPGRARSVDWVVATGGFSPRERPACPTKPLWSDARQAEAMQPLGFITQNVDLSSSNLHPVNGSEEPGLVRLIGLSTHSCRSMTTSTCIVDVAIDTVGRQFRTVPISPVSYPAADLNCDRFRRPRPGASDCDRYRDYVSDPYVIAHANGPSLLWLRRGGDKGTGYDKTALVRRFVLNDRERRATDLGQLNLSAFPEEMEPAFLLDGTTDKPAFLSLIDKKNSFRIMINTAVPPGTLSSSAELTCFRNPDSSWLRKPPSMVQDTKDPRRSYIVFSRAQLHPIENNVVMLAATLDLSVITLANGECVGVQQISVPDFFDGFATPYEINTARQTSSNPSPKNVKEAAAVFARYAERVRAGQLVLSDITGDGVPDLIQVARLPLSLKSTVLVGRIGKSGLNFEKIAQAQP
jgi:hypothetical protein